MTNHIAQKFEVTYNYNVYFTEDLFNISNELLINALLDSTSTLVKKIVVFVDDNIAVVNSKLLNQINDYFINFNTKIKLVCFPIIVKGGEGIKNNSSYVEKILEDINTYCIDRHSYTMAIGGGALLDMVGYASAIAHRGIRHIRVPSTVLSQNDSGVGVKNGVNYFNKKNFLGTFAPPYAVFNDYNFIETLSLSDYRCGIAEAIKVALIKDGDFYNYIVHNATLLIQRDKPTMKYVIKKCAELHLQHIASGDPFEKGSSRPLDFGHWAAHKLEFLSNYDIKHGEAVATGIALDVTYSYLKGYINASDWTNILQLIKQIGFQIYYPVMEERSEAIDYGVNHLLQGLEEFREHLGGVLTIMLLEKIGKGVEVNKMDSDLILKAIQLLKNYK